MVIYLVLYGDFFSLGTTCPLPKQLPLASVLPLPEGRKGARTRRSAPECHTTPPFTSPTPTSQEAAP